MTAALQRKSIPDKNAVARRLLPVDAVAEAVFGGIDIMNKAIFSDQCAGIAPPETVECRLALDLDVTENRVEIGDGPPHRIDLR